FFWGTTAFGQADQIDQPTKNFEALWKEFDLRYANFDLKKVNWDSVYQVYRPQVTEQTTNQALFNLCCEMVQTLNDGHVTIDPDFEDEPITCGPPYEFSIRRAFPTAFAFQLFEQVMDKTLKNNGFSEASRPRVTDETNFQYRTSSQFGYLRLDEMTEKFPLRRLKKALNTAFAAFQNKEGIIIDLRFNGGGWDKVGYQIAGHLVNKKQIGHYKKTRKKGTNEFKKLKSFSVKPKSKNIFAKPVIILTSDFTASAAEVFLLAVKYLPHVTIVGDTTEGIFSDMYEFELPNNWEVSLSHQQFFSTDMVNYEEIGIAPDVKVVNSVEDLENEVDRVIAKAIEVLQGK
ncbi:MAG: S41 family peptidase, partial [Bacteroidota bacterium]